MKIYKSTCYLLALLACPTMFCSAPAKMPSSTLLDLEHDIPLLTKIVEQNAQLDTLTTEFENQTNPALTTTPASNFLVGYQRALTMKMKLIEMQTTVSQLKDNQDKEMLNTNLSKQLAAVDQILVKGAPIIFMLQAKIEEATAKNGAEEKALEETLLKLSISTSK